MKKIITYGTFDLFHFGHLELLRRAKALGTHLTVAISTDAFTADEKNKPCECPYVERAAIVAAIRYVDRVIPEMSWAQKAHDIKTYGMDVFVIGDDWEGKFDELKALCEVVYLPRTAHISTSGIKKSLFDGGRAAAETKT